MRRQAASSCSGAVHSFYQSGILPQIHCTGPSGVPSSGRTTPCWRKSLHQIAPAPRAATYPGLEEAPLLRPRRRQGYASSISRSEGARGIRRSMTPVVRHSPGGLLTSTSRHRPVGGGGGVDFFAKDRPSELMHLRETTTAALRKPKTVAARLCSGFACC